MKRLLLFLLLCLTAIGQSLPTNTASVTLAWDPSPESDVAKYVLYQGQASGQYTRQIDVTNRVNGVLLCTNKVDGLAYSTTFYFVVTARSAAGLESPPSNEIAYTTPRVRFSHRPTCERLPSRTATWS
jgi:hypothetical protein